MSDFKFPEPGDDKIPARWKDSPPWKADPDLDDLIEIMEPMERDYWSEGGQPSQERQEFLLRIEARWRRWREIARHNLRPSQRRSTTKPKKSTRSNKTA